MKYYAWYHKHGKCLQIVVTHEGNTKASEETGIVYPSIKEAAREIERLNCGKYK